MTAATKNLIIEKGSNFSLYLQIFKDGAVKNLSSLSPSDITLTLIKYPKNNSDAATDQIIEYYNSEGLVAVDANGDPVKYSIDNTSINNSAGTTASPINYFDITSPREGRIKLTIPASVTAKLSTLIESPDNELLTRYNYFYYININNERYIRGRLAVRV